MNLSSMSVSVLLGSPKFGTVLQIQSHKFKYREIMSSLDLLVLLLLTKHSMPLVVFVAARVHC